MDYGYLVYLNLFSLETFNFKIMNSIIKQNVSIKICVNFTENPYSFEITLSPSFGL